MVLLSEQRLSQEAWLLSSVVVGHGHMKIAAFDFGSVPVVRGQEWERGRVVNELSY